MAIACVFDSLVIPDQSAFFSRFKSKNLTPFNLTAIFYFVPIVVISDKHFRFFPLRYQFYSSFFSRANEHHSIPISDGLHYYRTHSDTNANVGHKTKDFDFFGYKVHATVDSVSRFVLDPFF